MNNPITTLTEQISLSHQTTGKIKLPISFNYVGVFLSFRCPYKCSYCINRFSSHKALTYQELPGEEWLRFFDRLDTKLPITLQGGEPGVHPGFIDIVRNLLKKFNVDILTNLAFNLKQFVEQIDPKIINRQAPYAPIRVSYHPEQFTLSTIIEKVLFLQNAGFRVGIYGVLHPHQLKEIEYAKKVCTDLGIDFRTKEFLGWYNGKLYGNYAYQEPLSGNVQKKCECAPGELLIAPDGSIHRCHYFLYEKKEPIAHIKDSSIIITDDFSTCHYFGRCTPCDIKIKNNRFQNFGHVSVRIKNIRD
jgi:MoaA/NifB/PqqE/SkfB family radical SAM enzyme